MKKERYLVVLFFFVQNIIHNLGHPVTPAFVKSLGIQDYMFGVFFATMSFGLMVGGPIWGSLGDKGKKKTYIIIGLLMYSIGQFFFGYSNNQYLMVFFRFFSGLGVVSSITLLTSHLIEVTEKENRARFLAYIGAVTTLGASLGYFLGGFISTNPVMVDILHVTNFKEVFLVQAVLNIGYIVLIATLFTDRKCAMPTTEKNNIFKSFSFINKVDYRLFLFLIALAFITMGATNLNKFIDVYFNDLGYTSYDLGNFKMVAGYVSLFASILIVPFFSRFRKQIGLMMAIQVVSAAIVFYTFRSDEFIITAYSVYMVYIVLKAVFTPLEQNYISLHAKEGEYGKLMGIRQSFVSIGMVIGPLVGGFLYEKSSLLLFDSSAITFLIGLVLLVFINISYRKNRNVESSLD
ncbi:MAG TPA: MFS transporter [Bacillota bacterium]|nr:MFS transporter [Bacillota bacterium]